MGHGLAIMLTLLATRIASADCKPAAVPEGDPDLVRNLSVRLTANGIATTPTQGCPAVTVRLEQRGQQVHLQLADAFQRTGERDVRDVATAAAIVESWTLQVVENGSLPELRVPVPASPQWPASGISASVQSALATNTATWIGGGISACVHLGPTCTGVAALATLDTRATGDTQAIAQDAYAITALATLDLPRHLGGFIVTPGIGAGYGYTHIVTHHMAMGAPLDVPGHDHALRAMLHVAIARALSTRVSIFADLAAGTALVRTDSTSGPTGSVWLALGMRLEAP